MLHRLDRISEEIKKELGAIIREMKDPRIPLLTSVVGVRVTKDLRFCKVFVSVMSDNPSKSDVLKSLSGAAGFIRKELGNRVDLRLTPELTFAADDSIEYGSHIDELLHSLGAEEDKHV